MLWDCPGEDLAPSSRKSMPEKSVFSILRGYIKKIASKRTQFWFFQNI
jgi:hypothetical protein